MREQVGHTTHIEVEVDRLEQIPAVLAGGADTIMLDNFSLDDTRRGVELIDGKAIVEASGNMSLERVPAVAATGVDVVFAVGALTHSCAQHRPRIGLELAMADTPNASGEPGELYLDAAATEPVSPARHRGDDAVPDRGLRESGQRAPARQDGGAGAGRGPRLVRRRHLGARPDDVIFTSGGTESDNLAIKGIAMARMRKLGLAAGLRIRRSRSANSRQICRPRIIISAIEHPAVAQSAAWLHEWFGFEVVRIPVDAQAHLDLDALERELDGEASERTTMVSTMLANNEVGTVEPVEELVRIAHAHGVPIHVDAVQAAGQIPIRFRDWDVDALSVSGHKFGTPKGLGALLVRGRTPIEPVLSGGGQERGLRSGTQNVAGAVALAIGLNESNARMQAQYRELVASRDMLIDAVRRVAPRADLTGDPERRLPGHASFIFPGVTGEALLVDLDARGIAASSGSACAIGRHEIPATLLAMGLEPSIAKSALRMTFRKPLTREQVERISLAIEESYTDLTRH